jgi:hypothetical protein
MSFEIKQTTQFEIKKLAIVSKFGTIDVSGVFAELNIFDSILMPCMSGNIAIKDSVGLSKRLLFDGSEYLIVNISKSGETNSTNILKNFRIYKQTDRKNVNQNTEMYILHFVSEEMVYSEQQKVNQHYTGTYDQIAISVLLSYLKVSNKKIGIVEKTKGVHDSIVPLLTPFETVQWLSKRAVNSDNKANFLFFENKVGFNFVSLSTLYANNPLLTINFDTKNLSDTVNNEFLGIRNFNFTTSFDFLESVRNGFFANKFIGFDILTRNIQTTYLDINNTFKKGKSLNDYPIASSAKNRENKDASQMYDSKVVLYPYQTSRFNTTYVKTNDNAAATIIDDTHTYLPQRKATLNNLLQRRMNITLPGNFAISSGFVLNLNAHSYSVNDGNRIDNSISGKYLIVGTRHMIKPEKHETICEISSDSTNNPFISTGNLLKQSEVGIT